MDKSIIDDRDYDYSDEMLNPISECRDFSRRRDVNTFNMTNYLSCENCRHMTADNKCSKGADTRFSRQDIGVSPF
jgi:hypothetical protein